MPDDDVLQELVDRLDDAVWRLATAESVTAGLVANAAAQAPQASEWLLGGLVAWHPEVKQARLGVPPGPVVNAETAARMATGAAELLGADVTVSTTGVGGPDPEEGQPAGTVFVGVLVDGEVTTHELHLDGDPEAVCTGAADAALRLVVERLRAAAGA
ncbi:MAG: CinA domain protein [Frankiales bacterium]|nr:CinA domain protein [Frankiales bacterium]